jgi:predicted SAM-dependent methyltransferase
MKKINIGCGGRPLEGYINIDQDSLDDLRQRYPNQSFSNNLVIEDHDIFSLPYKSSSIDEVKADGLLEHLSFKEEPKFLYEVFRVLKPGGKFAFSVPDFEATCKAWLDAKDDWQCFFDDSDDAIAKQHWFGTYSYGNENRWGYMMATFFGSQNGEGQYHKNGYSSGKIRKMLNKIGFEIEGIESFRWKGDRDFMLNTVAIKK